MPVARHARLAVGAMIGAAIALHAVQLASPLRLDTDSALYLHIAGAIADGDGPSPDGAAAFPPGYPALVAVLDIGGVATSWGLVALNLAFLAVGLVAGLVALRHGLGLSEGEAAVATGLTLLAVTVVKYAAVPTSEAVFFGISTAAVATLCLARTGAGRRMVIAGLVLAGLACTVRTAGIALAPAVVLAFPTARGRALAAAGAVAAGAAATLVTPRYRSELRDGWDGADSVRQELADLARDVGALVANVPTSRVDELELGLVVIGVAALALIVVTLTLRRHDLGPVDGAVVGAVGLVFLWPSDHQRFLLPALPFVIGYAALLGRRAPRVALAGAAAFATVGVAALVYSVSLTFAGERFPERYAGGDLASSYRVAWGIARVGDRRTADATVVAALERYDPAR